MALRAVFFDIGETLVDERRYWREVCELVGVPEHALWAALGMTIERGEDHTAVFRHLGVERPAEIDRVVYDLVDLYPDALPCLEAVARCGVPRRPGRQPVFAARGLGAVGRVRRST